MADSSSGEDLKRGETTRRALVEAGLTLFGEYGLKGTTTRLLSKHSGANLSAIPYYFGSKEGLYHAVVRHIVERMQTLTEDKFAELAEVVESTPPSVDEATVMVKTLMGTMLGILLQSDEPKAWAQIIVREQANPTAAFDILYLGQMKPGQDLLLRLLSICTGLPADGDELKVRAHTLIGQVLSFVVSRESLLRQLDVRHLTERHVDLIRAVLDAHIDACLQVQPLSSAANPSTANPSE